MPLVELLTWSGCASHARAREAVRAAMADVGIDPDDLVEIDISSEDDAERERFVGSPTIRVAGRDVVETGGEPTREACRVYLRRDGSLSPVPDPQDLRASLRDALT